MPRTDYHQFLAACLTGLLAASTAWAAPESDSANSSRRGVLIHLASPPDSKLADVDTSGDETARHSAPEVIHQRYPDGSVMIERVVVQDAEGNYLNHGSWKMWDVHGTPVAEGHYDHGQREGLWTRWYQGDDVALLKETPYREHHAPFVSQATFEHGKLHGKWTIHDSQQHKVSEIAFADGQRDGKATWWYPNGQKMREIDFRDGTIDGQVRAWDRDGNLTAEETYQQGRKLAPKIDLFANKQKKLEAVYLHPAIVPTSEDSWWEAKLAQFETRGLAIKHGAYVAWYSNGQKRQQSEFRYDQPVGSFESWYSSGQRAIEGRYTDGKQTGPWTWWHTNGQKSAYGAYHHGQPVGLWMWWNPQGKVVQKVDYSRPGSSTESNIESATLPIPLTAPQAR